MFPRVKRMLTTPETNKVLIRKWIDAWVHTDLALLDTLFAPDYTVNGVLVGPDGVKQAVESLHAALPGGRFGRGKRNGCGRQQDSAALDHSRQARRRLHGRASNRSTHRTPGD